MRRVLWAWALLATASCGGDDDFESTPVDVSGVYSVAVTNQANACGFPNWTEGEQHTGIPLTITQDGKSITATIEGITGTLVSLVLGSSTFEGSVDGDRVTAARNGSVQHTQNGCAYTIDVKMYATLTGDALQGTLEYLPNTTGSPECASLDGCKNMQEFSGSRPPK